MSSFDPEQFLNATYEEANSTRLPLVPAGEYRAQVDRIGIRSGTIGKGEREGEPWHTLDVMWEIVDPAVREKLNMTKVTAKQSLFLDVTDSGALDMSEGKNVGIGRLREALGMNQPGVPFALSRLKGALGLIRVENKAAERDGTSLKKGDLYAEVTGVARL